MQHVVTGAPDGEVRYAHAIVDGRAHRRSRSGDDPDAEVTLTQTYADAVQIAAGRARRQRGRSCRGA